MNHKEFLDKVQALLKIAVAYSNCSTLRDAERLYTGNSVGGFYTPSRAIRNLKQSYSILEIPLSRDILLDFKYCIEYADYHLKNYSLTPCGRNCEIINFPMPL